MFFYSDGFMMPLYQIIQWCTSRMAIEDFLISFSTTGGASFCGAALFWYIQCPNRRCCQMKTVRATIERRREGEHDGS